MKSLCGLGPGEYARRCASFLALVLAATLLVPAVCGAASRQTVTTATPDSQFTLDAGSPSTGGFDWGGGYVAPPLSLPDDGGARFASIVQKMPSSYAAPAARQALGGSTAASFDLRAAGKLSPIRNQGRFGTCWAFAAFSSLESNLLPAESWDFAENNLANRAGFVPGYNDGGNNLMATAYLVRWSGPAAEADDLYVPYAYSPSPSPANVTVRKHVQEVLYIPPRSGPLDNDNLKWAVMTYGAVDTSMGWQDFAYNQTTSAYFSTGTHLNHDVACVGWDDNFPATSFAARPGGNGAFLVRNSWGIGFGQAGFFWVSYYDKAYATDNAVFDGAQATDNYSEVYQYDPLGWVNSVRLGDAPDHTTAWFANAFTADANGGLTAVGFYSATPNSTYEVRVAGALSSLSAASLSAHGTLAVPGYHTIVLDAPVALLAGTQFVVAARLTTPGWQFPIPAEMQYHGYAAPTAAKGQSYVSGDGQTWVDLTDMLANANVCLKGYASGGQAPGATPGPTPTPAPTPTPTPSPSPIDTASPVVHLSPTSVRRGRAARVDYSISHPAPVPAGATLAIAVVNGKGKVVLRATLRKVTLDADHSWSFRCWLARGTYSVRAVATDANRNVSATASARLVVRAAK